MFWNWLMIVMEEAVVSDGFEMEIHRMASLFYLYDGIITSTCPYWIQWDVDILTGIFEWLGLWGNHGKKVRLVFQICHIFVRNSNTVYVRWMMEEGETYRSHQLQHFQCPYWASDMTEGLLVTHQKIQNYVRRITHWEPPTPKIAQNVLRVFTKVVKFTGVPGGGVPGKGSDIDKSMGALHALTPAGHGVDHGVGRPSQ